MEGLAVTRLSAEQVRTLKDGGGGEGEGGERSGPRGGKGLGEV